MTAMSPEQRDEYAPPGSATRAALDAGKIEWPTLEQAAYEDTLGDLLTTGVAVLPDGTRITLGEVTGMRRGGGDSEGRV
jgi:hypothetical protein